ncbi:MAG: helix-turn-helix domain-containing protein [Alphaproteobacteria bacterium]
MRYTFDEWRHVARVFYELAPLAETNRIAAEAHIRRHQRLILTEVRFIPQRFAHVPSRIRGVDHNYLLYERYMAGTSRGLAADMSTRIDQGSVHVIDMSRVYRTVTSEVATAGVCIPHDLIGYDPSVDPPYRTLCLDTPQGRMLDLAHEALRTAVADGRADAEELAAAFLALVGTLMLKTAGRRAVDRGAHRSSAMLRAFIAHNLADPELTPERICGQMGVSRSVLYREFRPDGGVARYIADQRLDQCFADLAAAAHARGAVRSVAERWGFFHPGNFNRAFRDRFGISPSDCLDGATGEDAPDGSVRYHPVHDWLRADGSSR